MGLDWVDAFNSGSHYGEVHCGTAPKPAVISNKSDELISIWLTPHVALSIGS